MSYETTDKNYDDKLLFNEEDDFDFNFPFNEEEDELVLIDDDELAKAIENGQFDELDDLITA